MGCQCSQLFNPIKVDPKNRRDPYVVSTAKEHERTPESTIIDPPKRRKEVKSSGIDFTPATINHRDIVSADPDTFNSAFLQRRQAAIDNHSYRKQIDSCSHQTLQQLENFIRDLAKNKPIIDQFWIVFYWIARNIEYDAVSFFNDNIPSQTVEAVFKTKKSVCEGYSRLYKHLCDKIGLRCEKISGYAKGYGHDDEKKDKLSRTNHAWNAVEIDNHWYLLDSTWGAGNLTDKKAFERKLNSFYFLVRPEHIIYTHLPEIDRWQLLSEPINQQKFAEMPNLKSHFFRLNLELVGPRYIAHVPVIPRKSFGLVQIGTPPSVQLSAELRLNGKEIEGAVQILYERKRQMYNCYFAPNSVGKHEITIFAGERKEAGVELDEVMKSSLTVTQLPTKLISFPEIHQAFHNLDLQLVSPVETRVIEVSDSQPEASITLRAPADVILIGKMKISGQECNAGEDVHYDEQNDVWICNFIPERSGHFDVCIYAKKSSDPDSYASAIIFKVHANLNSKWPQSYPRIRPSFHQLNLQIAKPRRGSGLVWSKNSSFIDVHIRAPDHVILTCSLKRDQQTFSNGALAQFDASQQVWQLLFAPEHPGVFDLLIFAKDKTESEYTSVMDFRLNVPQIGRPMTFPTVFGTFFTNKCQIYEPLNGILTRDSRVNIHCSIPNALEVAVKIDGQWMNGGDYQNSIFKREIIVGKKDVTIIGKFSPDKSYNVLFEYSVQ